MKDERKTKGQLVKELAECRQRIAELEQSEARQGRAEEALRESEARFTSIFRASPIGICITRLLDGQIVEINDAFLTMFGYTREEMMGRTTLDLCVWGNPENRDHVVKLLREQGRLRDAELTFRKKSGELGSLLASAEVVDIAGEQYMLSQMHDITKRKQAEEAMRQSETLFHSLVDSMPQNVFSKDLQGRFTFANQHYCVAEGKALEDILGKTDFDLHPPELASKYRSDDRRVVETGQLLDIVEEHQPLGGNKSYVQVIKAPLRDSTGNVAGILGIFWDITERKQAEEALRESEGRTRAYYEHLPIPTYTWQMVGPDMVLVDYNLAAETITQGGVTRVVGAKAREMYRDRPDIVDDLSRCVTEKTIIKREMQYYFGQQGGYKELLVTYAPVPLDLVLVHTEDITGRKQAEKALRESHEKLELLFEMLPVGVSVLDQERKLVIQNPALEKILDVPRESLLRGNYHNRRYLRVDGTPMPVEEFASTRVINGEAVVHDVETGVVKENGDLVWISVSAAACPFTDWKVVVVTTDITKRKRAEEALIATETRYRRLFEAAKDGILILDADTGKVVDANPFLLDLLGYSLEDLLGKELWEIGLFHDIAASQAAFLKLRDQGYIRYEDLPLETRDGRSIAVEFVSNVYAANGKQVIQCNIRDITARKQAEEALAHERNLLRTLIDSLPDRVYAKDAEGRFIIKNQADARQMGAASTDEVVGKTDFDYFPQGLAQQYFADDQAVIQSGQPLINREEPFVNADGTQGWMLTSKVPLRNTQGKVIGLVGVGRDITERRRLADAERDQRILAETLAETASILTSTLDFDAVLDRILHSVGRVVPHDAANIMLVEGDTARVVAQHGYERRTLSEAFLREHRYPLETPQLHEMFVTGLPVLIADTALFPGWEERPETAWIRSYAAVPIRVHEEVVGFLNLDSKTPGFFTPDHAQRLQAFADQASIAIEHAQLYGEIRRHAAELEQRVKDRTAQLNHAKERIEAILNSSSDVMILCRPDGTIDQTNPAFDQIFGRNPAEAVLQPLTSLVIPSHVPALGKTFETAVETRQPQRLEVTAQCAGGTALDADIILSPVIEHNGRLLGVVCSLRDITGRKRMENQLREMLQHEIELSELKSRYVSMAAHDLRNPLTVIQTAVGAIQRYADRLTDEQRQIKFDNIYHSVKVMVELLDDILLIGQVETGKLKFEPQPLDLITFCQDLAAESQQASSTTQQIKFSHLGISGTVCMDAKLLRHILSNLLSNAIKYSPTGSAVLFDARGESDAVTFRVQDTGIGIPKADQARLFETFFRAGNALRIPGTGLGLAIVKQSVDLHGGTIVFESEEGVGTTFTVTLPHIPIEK